MSDRLFPTEHRGYRELYASLRQLADPWECLDSEPVGSE